MIDAGRASKGFFVTRSAPLRETAPLADARGSDRAGQSRDRQRADLPSGVCRDTILVSVEQMHDLDLILTLTAGLATALAFGYLTNRLGLSPIVGYLLAGIAVGPSTPGFVANRELADQLAEIGVILLMFGVGLHFHFKELLAVRRIALPGAIGQSLLATALGAVAAWFFGWGWTAGIVYGLAISVASTVVLLRVLTDNNELHTPTGHI